MNYCGIEECSMVNGDGLRTVLWVSGCSHNCPGCHNPSTHDPNAGSKFNSEALETLLESLKEDYCSGLTLSGGDPLFPSNREEVCRIAKTVKEDFPKKDIWLYTGYEYDDISSLPVLEYVDVLVTGKFIKDLLDVNYPWAGSTNQTVFRKINGKFIAEKDVANYRRLEDNHERHHCA
ncbi:MAG: anaerobic ribonucleoside-triphosphate reductase activating protein [Lachnospiraceae bacterium]|nr:anaerobic ribonucleoside-triphosphate reductase activating protein [Lachnospiraceae bacterium]